SLVDGAARRGERVRGGSAGRLAGRREAASSGAGPTAGAAAFMAGQSLRNAGELGAAEKYWRVAVKNKPDDVDALLGLARTLSDQQRGADALTVLNDALKNSPEPNKDIFHELGSTYAKLNNNAKSTEMMIMYLALSRGQTVADVPARTKGVKAGSGAASVLASQGPPDAIYDWESDGKKLQTWVYKSKHVGYTFDSATLTLQQKSDWSTVDTAKK